MSMTRTKRLFAEQALLPERWARNVMIHYDTADGHILKIERDAKPGGDDRAGIVVPGMPNLHSHAFQRAMAGLAERAGGKDDSFWTWRQTMYRLVARLGPDDIESIAAHVYAEMLCEGYTSVAEFHYLHNRPDGGRYEEPAENALRIARAADHAGIGIVILPVLYCQGGFGGEPLKDEQLRFRSDPDFVATIADTLANAVGNGRANHTGLAIHSLRAAGSQAITEAIRNLHSADASAPIHIHIAEQVQEVTDCYDWSSRTPVEWLYDHFAVGSNWCLVHATNVTRAEIDRIAESDAVVGLCPTTEANLGDGLFPLRDFVARNGRFGIGSDSQISVNPMEELRWLEYGQRLVLRRRNIAATRFNPSVGGYMWRSAAAGGAGALGMKTGAIEAGYRADLLVLNENDLILEGRDGDDILDSLVFASSRPPITRVLAGGKWVVENGGHVNATNIGNRYRRALRDLF